MSPRRASCFLTLTAVLAATGCRALLDGDDLDLQRAGGGGADGSGGDRPDPTSSGSGNGGSSTEGVGAGGPTTGSTGVGGGTSSTSTTSSGSTSSSTGAGGGSCIATIESDVPAGTNICDVFCEAAGVECAGGELTISPGPNTGWWVYGGLDAPPVGRVTIDGNFAARVTLTVTEAGSTALSDALSVAGFVVRDPTGGALPGEDSAWEDERLFAMSIGWIAPYDVPLPPEQFGWIVDTLIPAPEISSGIHLGWSPATVGSVTIGVCRYDDQSIPGKGDFDLLYLDGETWLPLENPSQASDYNGWQGPTELIVFAADWAESSQVEGVFSDFRLRRLGPGVANCANQLAAL